MELALRNAGFRDTYRALSWAIDWAIVRESLGQEPTVEEVGDWWKQSRRTAFRHQAAFREAFPNLDTPAILFESEEARTSFRKLAALGDEMESKGKRRAQEQIMLAIGMLPAQL
jgi:hypothetical protein